MSCTDSLHRTTTLWWLMPIRKNAHVFHWVLFLSTGTSGRMCERTRSLQTSARNSPAMSSVQGSGFWHDTPTFTECFENDPSDSRTTCSSDLLLVPRAGIEGRGCTTPGAQTNRTACCVHITNHFNCTARSQGVHLHGT